MTVPTLAEPLEIVRVVLGVAFAVATGWVALTPAARWLMSRVRHPATESASAHRQTPAVFSQTSRAA